MEYVYTFSMFTTGCIAISILACFAYLIARRTLLHIVVWLMGATSCVYYLTSKPVDYYLGIGIVLVTLATLFPNLKKIILKK